VTSAIEKFVSMINPLIEADGAVTLDVVGEFFHLDEVRVKYSMEYLLNFDFLMREFKRHLIGSIGFIRPVTLSDMQAFLKVFLSSSFSSDPYEAISEGLLLGGIQSLNVGVLKKIKEEEGELDIRKTVKKTYFNAVSFTRGVMNKIKSGERISMKKAKRVVESMVDLILDQEELLFGMTAIKDYDEYTYHHSVNVSILSVALGQRLGLPKRALMELGLVALFHDIGKTEIPPEILNKPSKFTDAEWETMKKHPVIGVRSILKMKGFDATSIRAAIVAFEHHIHHDHTGYPRVDKVEELDLYSRIVSIADQYDGMTSARVYSRVPMPQDKALKLMLERSGVQLDPLLMKFFVNMIGVYPIGTLVMLDTKELGIVYGSNIMLPDRPRVMVITDNTGKKVQGFMADLSEKAAGGRYPRSIVKTLDHNKYKINLAEYVL
ncbi:MAG: HD-GYP domain-containing protein, partial [Thermodesulfovibrionales bacterium]|nr:HD-GYP domain-containing protein [Thermodesulfovibrionales bacterium]